MAGAFTGDHNQILGESNDDVRGIRSRVTAGIQHFSFEDEQVKVSTGYRIIDHKSYSFILHQKLNVSRKIMITF